MRQLIPNGRCRPGTRNVLFILGACCLMGLATGDSAGPVLKLEKDSSGSSFTLSFEGEADRYYEIWSRDSLDPDAPWHLAEMVLGRDGLQTWTDGQADTVSERYYRIINRSVDEPADADGDGFDDVYELSNTGNGFNPLTANPVTVSAVTASSTEIAAGAVETAPHQTLVTLQVSPPGTYPVAVWLEGGDGFGVGTAQHFAGGAFRRSGAATISGDGHTFAAGGDTPSEEAIRVMTNADGRAELVLTSSNEIGEQCTVHARAGTGIAVGGAQANSPPIVFAKGDLRVTFPGTLVAGAPAGALVSRTFKGQPLEGHDIVFFVRRIRVAGLIEVIDEDAPGVFDRYASIDPSERRVLTDADGNAAASVMIGDDGGLEFVEVSAQDLQVFGD